MPIAQIAVGENATSPSIVLLVPGFGLGTTTNSAEPAIAVAAPVTAIVPMTASHLRVRDARLSPATSRKYAPGRPMDCVFPGSREANQAL